MEEDARDEERQRKQDGRNAERVTQAVHRMAMTGAVLRDPLLVGASAQHAEDDNTKEKDPVFSPDDPIRCNLRASSRKNSAPSASTYWSQRKHRNASCLHRFGRLCMGRTNWREWPGLRENFQLYKRHFR